MIIRARQDGNVIVFDLEGQLDFETTLRFEETCKSVFKKQPGAKIVFNFERLKFVGSSGINQFVKVLKTFNQLDEKPRYCQTSSEFTKILRAFQTSRNPFEIFEAEGEAIKSFEHPLPPKKLPRKKKIIEN